MFVNFLNMNNHFDNRQINNIYLITLPEEFRNGIWAAKYGPIQHHLRVLSSDVEMVVVNAKSCRWIDPFPMLSLLLSLAEISSEKRICFVIPDIISDDSRRILEFLAKEGFFSIMLKYGIQVLFEHDYNDFITNNYSQNKSKHYVDWISTNVNGYLYYNDSTILEASIDDLAMYKDENDIEKYIEGKLKRVKHRIIAHVPETIANEISWKINLFLKETVCNVFEHAYNNNSPKYVGIYVRHRIGMMDTSLSVEDRKRILNLINKEKQDISLFRNEFPKSESSYLELFVIDAGVGLTIHLKKKGEELSFRKAWLDTVDEGRRSKRKLTHTQFGGLYTLGKLLSEDFMLARDYDFWAGDMLPIMGTNNSYLLCLQEKDPRKYVTGFAVMSRLGIKAPTNNIGWCLNSRSGECFIDAMKEERNIYDKYFATSSQKMSMSLAYIKDDRFDLSYMKKTSYLEQRNNVRFCIFLPPKHISKNMIFHTIDDKLLALTDITTQSRAIIIADIPILECSLYQFAIEKASFGGSKYKNVDRIILLSQSLSVYVLIRRGNTFVRSEDETLNFISSRPSSFSPHKSLFHMVEWLKTHDSMLLWHYIKKNNKIAKFFVNKEVEWYRENDKQNLRGYLDFEKTLTDNFLKNLYHHSLTRSLCLGFKRINTYITEDPLMTGIVSYMNTLSFMPTNGKEKQIVALGSVYVSGITQAVGVAYNINMFLHKDFYKFNTLPSMHLFAWPDKNLFDESEELSILTNNYRRVGSTYSIAPFGWRYFPIPRYKGYTNDGNACTSVNGYFFTHEEAEKIEFKSVYKCAPKNTYDYWQGRNGVFMGISHTNYETSHDILNINFPFIIKESFLLGGDLACFLLGEIASAFNINLDTIDFHSNGKLRKGVSSYCSSNKTKYANKRCSFIVYPFHANTEIIIDIIKDYIKGEDVKIVPLIPLKKERNGTCFQPSPLTIEMLKSIILQLREGKGDSVFDINAMLFDDAVVDGKTQEEIKHILFSLGVKHVMSVFILERRRLPYNTSDVKKSSVFWRLDLPRLGTKNNCPLCAALETYNTFSSHVISDYAKRRISEWNLAWGVKTANAQESVHSMMPVKLDFPNPEVQGRKRFGIYFEDEECKQCGGDNNKIELNSSLGLTLYMGELLSMTSRDDKMLQYCTDIYHLDDHTLLEMLCTNLLLYGNAISHKVREKIILEIFRRANNIDECDSHTAFAALVLVIQERDVLSCLVEEYCKMSRSGKKPNYDIMILLSFLGLRYGNDFHIDEAKRLTRTSLSEDKAYRKFHSELFNGYGKTHTRPIGRMAENAISTTQDIRRVEDALDCIDYSLNEIRDLDLVSWNRSVNDCTIDQVKNEIVKFKKIISQLDWEGYLKKQDVVLVRLEALIIDLKSIHRGLFMPLNIIDGDGIIKDEFKLRERISKWCKDGKLDVGISSIPRCKANGHNIFERWIIWDSTVDSELTFLLENANDYADEEILSPVFNRSKEKHKVWISVEYAEDLSTMTLLIFNKSKVSVEFIETETAKKPRYEKIRLYEELKIKVKYRKIVNDIIVTKITFPII